MSTSLVALILGVLGCLGSASGVIAKFIEGRRNTDVAERRLGFEEMQAALVEQRERMDQMQREHQEDRAEIASQREQIIALSDKVEEQRQEIRRAHDERDRALVALEAVRGGRREKDR